MCVGASGYDCTVTMMLPLCIENEYTYITTAPVCGAQVDVGITSTPASVATNISMEILDATVKVLQLVSFRAGTVGNPHAGSPLKTMAGSKGTYLAQLGLGAVLSDKRQYPRLFANDGSPAISGLINFTSALQNTLQVDGRKGTLTLLGNHHSSISVEAKTCSGVSTSIDLFCNLDPSIVGDGDVGKVDGAPIDAAQVGDTFIIPVRVNTGGRALSFFRVNIKFNKDAFQVTKVQHTVSQRDGSVTFINVRPAAMTRVFLDY